MNSTNSDHFYSELPVFDDGLITHLSKEERFVNIPDDWHIIITDIKGSTQAIQRGLHQQVNLVATASIISALNISRDKKVNFPFFFGGDGATLVIPNSMRDEVMSALSVYQRNVKRTFDLELRVDEVPISLIYEKNHKLTLSKTKLSSKYTIPVVLGEGLLFADDLIKQRRFKKHPEENEGLLNLEGMECRWDAVKPSEKTKQIVCLLLRTRSKTDQAKIFQKVMQIIEEVYGSYEERRPISVKALKLTASLERFSTENELKFGESSLKRNAKSVVGYAVGQVYLRRESGKKYLENLVELSDTLVMNGMLNTVISGTVNQRLLLIEKLDEMEQAKEIVYATNICSESIMSCYVQDRKDNHVHFIDGSEGGYTAAATVLKKKLANF